MATGTARERALQALEQGTSHVVVLLGPDGTLQHLSPSIRRVLGYEPSELEGTNVLALLHPDDVLVAVSVLLGNAAVPADGMLDRDDIDTAGEYRLLHREGHWVTVEAMGNNFLDNPDIEGLLLVARDVSDRRLLDDAVRGLAAETVTPEALEPLVRALDARLTGTASALYVVDDPSLWVAPSVPRSLLTDEGPWAEAVATATEVLRPATGAGGVQACWSVPVGPGLGCLVIWSSVHDEPLLGWWETIRRVADLASLALLRRRSEHALRFTATHDRLTGLLNREGWFEAVGDGPGAVLLADLDGFKEVNDAHGHAVGDRTLAAAAERLLSVLRVHDVLARFGGDEFALFLPDADDRTAASIADRLLEAFAAGPVEVDGLALPLGVTIGVDTRSEGGPVGDRLDAADRALYVAKRAGGGCWTTG